MAIGAAVVELDLAAVDLLARVGTDGGEVGCKHCRGMSVFDEAIGVARAHGALPPLPRATACVFDACGDPRVVPLPRNVFIRPTDADLSALLNDDAPSVH
jgi:hypothetical protein